LQTKGLDKRQNGNVMLVAPREEIDAREKLELEAKRQVEELAPLRSEFVQMNYSKAEDVAKLLKNTENRLLSDRGQVTVDERTNTLLIQDTALKLAEVRKIVERIDIPVRQVLIEARVVIANDDFGRDLGARFGISGVKANGSQGIIGTSANLNGTDGLVTSAVDNIIATGQPFPTTLPSLGDRLNSSLAVVGPSFALSILRPDVLLDLELSALQTEGRGEVLSNPKVITSNQNKAIIKQGQEIPYQEASASGATTTAFKEALLKMEVKPQITPDDRIIMEILVSKDNADFSRAQAVRFADGSSGFGPPPIDKREVTTTVLVENGQTVVLGGVYEQTKTTASSKVPLLGDVPLLGNLFKSTLVDDNKQELLIFVTPKIIKETLVAR
jgi:type IV pilus assembly protein PilQ